LHENPLRPEIKCREITLLDVMFTSGWRARGSRAGRTVRGGPVARTRIRVAGLLRRGQ